MIYERILPSFALKGFIKEYLLLHFKFDKAAPPLIKPFPPLPEHGLEFFPKGRVTSVNLTSGEVKTEPSNAIFGQQVSRFNFIMPSEDYLMIRVIFHSGCLFRLLKIPLTEFTNKKIDAETVLHHEMQMVNDSLCESGNYPNMIEIVERYLLSKISKIKSDSHPVDMVGKLLLNDPTRFSLDWLADQANLSPRQLERKFIERMGIGPKLFSRICRFHQAFLWKKTHQQEDWLSVAVRYGYTDFHHLFKDFKEFSGVTPNSLISEYAQSPEKLLRLA